MAIKIILLDLDGTLLNSAKQISPANLAALEKAAAHGIHIVPSTGRFFAGMPQSVRDLPFVRYAITVNGGQIYDRQEDTVLHRCEIPLPVAEPVMDLLEQLPVIYDCYIDGWGYMDRCNYQRIDEFIAEPHINHMVKSLRRPVEDLRSFIRRENKDLQKLQMFFKDMDLRVRVLQQLTEQLPHMAVTSSLPINIEINHRHASKGRALLRLCEHLGVEQGDTMSFGDGSNDRSMIETAGIGVVMANGDPSLLEIADYVTDTNDNDGVAKAIEKFCFGCGA